MSFAISRRKFVMLGAQAAAVTAASRFLVVEAHGQSEAGKYAAVYRQLDQFVEQYMRNMNAPGMTLVLADRDGVQRVAVYGFSDLERKTQLKPAELFAPESLESFKV